MLVTPLTRSLLRMGIAIFFSYLSVALALPIIPLFVTHNLALTNWLGGLAVGIAFLSTIFSRHFSGKYADTRSPKRCTLLGLFCYATAAVICFSSTTHLVTNTSAYALLLCGRLILGIGESMALTGLTSWYLSQIGTKHSGKILSIIGIAIYGAFAVGGPLGLAIYKKYSFATTMNISFILPLIGVALLITSKDVRPNPLISRPSSFSIIQIIWKEGAVVCLQGVGFAVLGAFTSLHFKSNGWPYAGCALSFFGIGFIASRILFSSLLDRKGGVVIALISLLVEMTGQLLIYSAPNMYIALMGALMTGLGCSMIFPAMGVEVVKKVPKELKGSAVGYFSAFQDIAYAVTAPFAGWLADTFNYSVTFILGACAAALGIAIILVMNKKILS